MTPARYHRLKTALERRQLDLTVLLDGVHKVFNLSAVIRTADAVGLYSVHSVLTDESTRAEISSAHSSGTGKWVNWVNHPDTETAFRTLRDQGYRLIGADLDDTSIDFREVDFCQPIAVVMGAEKFGLSEFARSQVDQKILIPMAGLGGSLNVSVATAVILYEAQRQRQQFSAQHLSGEEFEQKLFEWCHPEVSEFCRLRELPYPGMDERGALLERVEGMDESEIRAYMRGPWREKNTCSKLQG